MGNSKKSNILPIFPQGLGLYKLSVELPKNLKKKIEKLDNLKYEVDHGFHGHNSYNIENKGSAMDDLGLKGLKKHMQTYVESYCEETGFKYGIITHDWVVSLPKGGHIEKRNYINSYMSGIYYPYESKDSTSLILLDIKAIILANAKKDENMDNYQSNIAKGTHFSTTSVSIKPEQGLLVIFPSYMYSYLPKTKNNLLSIHFNTCREDLIIE